MTQDQKQVEKIIREDIKKEFMKIGLPINENEIKFRWESGTQIKVWVDQPNGMKVWESPIETNLEFWIGGNIKHFEFFEEIKNKWLNERLVKKFTTIKRKNG